MLVFYIFFLRCCRFGIYKYNQAVGFAAGLIIPSYYRLTKTNKMGVNYRARKVKVILSLTTIPSRVHLVHLSIESILRQSVKPDKIILYLDKENFEGLKLPNNLLEQRKRGLEIKYCEDLKPHKKYYYSMQAYKDSAIITIDDDIYYPPYIIKSLVKNFLIYPNEVSCFRAHKISFYKDGTVKPYNQWEHLSSFGYQKSSHLLCATGVGAVLYPPNCLVDEAFNREKMMSLSPIADDIWLKTMEILSEVRVRNVAKYSMDWIEVLNSQKVALHKINVKKNENDIQFQRLIKEYKINFHNLT